MKPGEEAYNDGVPSRFGVLFLSPVGVQVNPSRQGRTPYFAWKRRRRQTQPGVDAQACIWREFPGKGIASSAAAAGDVAWGGHPLQTHPAATPHARRIKHPNLSWVREEEAREQAPCATRTVRTTEV